MSSNCLDVVIPCYNASQTVRQAVLSALSQVCVRRVWLIDDGSSDDTWQVLLDLKGEFGDKICLEKRQKNGGAALARNIGAMLSGADLVAFLDADDVYVGDVLSAAVMAFDNIPSLGLVRLRLEPIDFPKIYTDHQDFAAAWRQLSMTVAGNMVFRRTAFLACGGFSGDELFRRFGGEDGALGLACVANMVVGTLFDIVPCVAHRYHANIHAKRLLDMMLFDVVPDIANDDVAYAHAITRQIGERLTVLKNVLNAPQTGVMALKVCYEGD